MPQPSQQAITIAKMIRSRIVSGLNAIAARCNSIDAFRSEALGYLSQGSTKESLVELSGVPRLALLNKFDEAKHSRGKGGKFAPKGTGHVAAEPKAPKAAKKPAAAKESAGKGKDIHKDLAAAVKEHHDGGPGGTGLTYIPDVVENLMKKGYSKQEAHDAIMEHAKSGRMEVRPNGSLGVPNERKELMPPGPRGSELAYIRDMDPGKPLEGKGSKAAEAKPAEAKKEKEKAKEPKAKPEAKTEPKEGPKSDEKPAQKGASDIMKAGREKREAARAKGAKALEAAKPVSEGDLDKKYPGTAGASASIKPGSPADQALKIHMQQVEAAKIAGHEPPAIPQAVLDSLSGKTDGPVHEFVQNMSHEELTSIIGQGFFDKTGVSETNSSPSGALKSKKEVKAEAKEAKTKAKEAEKQAREKAKQERKEAFEKEKAENLAAKEALRVAAADKKLKEAEAQKAQKEADAAQKKAEAAQGAAKKLAEKQAEKAKAEADRAQKAHEAAKKKEDAAKARKEASDKKKKEREAAEAEDAATSDIKTGFGTRGLFGVLFTYRLAENAAKQAGAETEAEKQQKHRNQKIFVGPGKYSVGSVSTVQGQNGPVAHVELTPHSGDGGGATTTSGPGDDGLLALLDGKFDESKHPRADDGKFGSGGGGGSSSAGAGGGGSAPSEKPSSQDKPHMTLKNKNTGKEAHIHKTESGYELRNERGTMPIGGDEALKKTVDRLTGQYGWEKHDQSLVAHGFSGGHVSETCEIKDLHESIAHVAQRVDMEGLKKAGVDTKISVLGHGESLIQGVQGLSDSDKEILGPAYGVAYRKEKEIRVMADGRLKKYAEWNQASGHGFGEGLAAGHGVGPTSSDDRPGVPIERRAFEGVAIHEIGHMVHFRLEEVHASWAAGPDVDDAMHAIDVVHDKTKKSQGASVSSYSETDKYEMFAEAFAAFHVNRSKLAAEFPDHHEMIEMSYKALGMKVPKVTK